jgi:hypothetical protein
MRRISGLVYISFMQTCIMDQSLNTKIIRLFVFGVNSVLGKDWHVSVSIQATHSAPSYVLE